MEEINFLLVGVGGQGILTASDILATVGLRWGYDVKKSEVHGMSQRGGAVSSHVRFGPKVYSPLIGRQNAHYLLSFELLEALRWAQYLHPQGVVLADTEQVLPVAVSSGKAHYPDVEEARRELAARAKRVVLFDATRLAQELGDPRVANTVLLGALAAILPIPESLWEAVISQRVPSRYVALNQRAFELGQTQVEDK